MNKQQGEETREWIFTFGFGHDYPNGFVPISGTFDGTRAEMFRRYGRRWSMQYPSEEEAGVQEYNLREIK